MRSRRDLPSAARSLSHIRDIGYKLWQVFSEQLDQDIHKRNFKSALSRLNIRSSSQAPIVIQNKNNNFNFCPSISHPNHQENQNQDNNRDENNNKYLQHDLIIAPKIIRFYNREIELKSLSNWIFNQNINLISVLGRSGIGKTALVKRFIDLNLDQFEVIVWKNLKLTPSLNQNITEIFTKYSESRDAKFYIPTEVCQVLNLLQLLKEKRCLIILDNVETIFISGQFAGEYKPEYQDYQNFFKLITETEHQSNIILISQEQSDEMHCLDQELYPIKRLELSGLDDVNILENIGLKDRDSWSTLVKLYEGNPFYLKEIAILIKDVFGGKVTEFLSENSLIITKTMQAHFQEKFNRLSSIEQQIILELSKFDQPVAREKLRENLDLAFFDLINGLQSLQQRYLITKIEQEEILFNLETFWREYVNIKVK